MFSPIPPSTGIPSVLTPFQLSLAFLHPFSIPRSASLNKMALVGRLHGSKTLLMYSTLSHETTDYTNLSSRGGREFICRNTTNQIEVNDLKS